jgi:hypothetical protein
MNTLTRILRATHTSAQVLTDLNIEVLNNAIEDRTLVCQVALTVTLTPIRFRFMPVSLVEIDVNTFILNTTEGDYILTTDGFGPNTVVEVMPA